MKYSIILLTILSVFSSSIMAAKKITLWRHNATEIEITNSLAAVKRFNASQKQWHVEADLIPEASYTQSIKAAAQAKLLPCVIEVDQPMVPNLAWSGFIKPLDGFIDDAVIASINDSGKGSYNGRIYSLGPLDVSLALFTRKSLIAQAGVRYPTINQPWNKNEFMAFLDAVKATGQYQYPFDLQAQDSSEWISYAWLPLMISWGADLVDRSDNRTVDGVLNAKEAVAFGQWIQHLVSENYIDASPDDEHGFINGKVALQYGGSWDLNAYYNAFKEDLAVLPLPDLGYGTVSGGGGWHWAMAETCQHPEGAKALITFLMTPEEQSAMANVIGIFPTNSDAAKLTKSYAENGQWRMFFDFSKRFARMRPETPAYMEMSAYYKKAMKDIVNGMAPEVALDLAVENIEAAFERHQNYTEPYMEQARTNDRE